MLSGALQSVPPIQMLNGANRLGMLSRAGAWEVMQFAAAEEIAPGTWRLSSLLRGQLGTGDAMLAGAAEGAPVVVLDGRVVPAGLAGGQAGLALNWKVGPVGHPVTADRYAAFEGLAGGVRALLPLAPVHLRVRRTGDDLTFSWVRCGRVDADDWAGEDIPLGEEAERYRIEVGHPDASPLRVVVVSAPQWTYAAGEIAADFGAMPATIQLSARQVGARTGAGLEARATFDLA